MKIFLVLVNAVILVFITGIIAFVFQYRRRKLLHEKEKAAAQLEIQQQTMQFIGREIHDSVAQKITLAAIYTQRLEFENPGPGLSEKLGAISTILSDSLQELRSLSKDLSGDRLQHTPLTDLLQQECEWVNHTGICRMELDTGPTPAMDTTVKIFLLRIVQEFIQNSLRHSGCSNIVLTLRGNDGGLVLAAADNGKGFDTAALPSQGIGLANMRRRMEALGGLFTLLSKTGEGTRLQLFVPAAQLCPAKLPV